MTQDRRLRQIMMQAQCPNMEFAEKEFTLTHMLQVMSDRGVLARLAFKGGTSIRKTLSGPSARLSTDLDFTAMEPDGDPEDIVLDIHQAMAEPFHGFQFAMGLDPGQDWYFSGDSVGMGIRYEHAGMGLSGEIRVQVSMRAKTLLEPLFAAQLPQTYFKDLGFEPAPLLRLRVEEMLAEKIRALCQREKTRDLYDLHWFSMFPLDKDAVRSLATLKMWEAADSLTPAKFQSRLSAEMQWDWDDLASIVKGFNKSQGAKMLERCGRVFRFLAEQTDDEAKLAADPHRQQVALAQTVSAKAARAAGPSEADHWSRAWQRTIEYTG